jgi:hypothetical protein
MGAGKDVAAQRGVDRGPDTDPALVGQLQLVLLERVRLVCVLPPPAVSRSLAYKQELGARDIPRVRQIYF